MSKYKLIKRTMPLVLATAISTANPFVVKADTFFGKTKDEWIETAKEAGKEAVEKASEAEKFIHEKAVEPAGEVLSNVELFSPKKLWLITDMPTQNPEEQRNYYFIRNVVPKMKWTFYYDQYGNKVSSNSPQLSKTEIREMYTYLVDTENVFRVETWLDKDSGSYTVNYVDFDVDYLYDPFVTCKYGRIADWEMLIPENERKESYSNSDLDYLLNTYINNLDYSLNSTNLSRKK